MSAPVRSNIEVNRLIRVPLVDLLDDLSRAECRFDPDLHTGPDAFTEESVTDRMVREDVAKDICESCPVWASCLELALRTRPQRGIWAGMSPMEIRALGKSARTAVAPAAPRELGEVA